MADIFKYTILEYFGDGAQKCGYCRGKDSSYTYGMWAHTLHCPDYQNLINRGWRRSGAYLYKPRMEVTCCPLYTIRCDAINFRISKSQKKTIKKLVRFILTDIKPNANDLPETKNEMKPKAVKPGQGIDPNKPPCRKAKLIRQERKKQKVNSKPSEPSTSKTIDSTSNSSQLISVEKNLIEFPPDIRPPDLKLTTTPKEEKANDEHNDNFKNEILEKDVGWLNIPEKGIHKLKVKLIHSNMKSQEFNSSLKESYEIYQKYQQIIHNDPLDAITYQQYLRFLVKSPLEETRKTYNSGDQFGTFHMQYILDNHIIAVGVLDILPQCVSSVYFYYDPDYSFLSLGTFAALQEIKLVQQLNQIIPSIKFYYMGYYIHSCPKMLYKAAYVPSYLLCPFTNSWVPFEISRLKIDVSKCARLCDEDVIDENAEFDINEINILKNQILYKMNEYIDSHGNTELAQIKEWAQFIETSQLSSDEPTEDYFCEECFCGFLKLSLYKRHMLEHHPANCRFFCDYCDKKYMSKNSVKRHIFKHHKEKYYKHANITNTCRQCKKRFISKQRLKDHLRYNCIERPLSCDHCDKKFSERSVLYGHLMTHIDKKPFSCELCDKSFLRREELRKHLVSHPAG